MIFGAVSDLFHNFQKVLASVPDFCAAKVDFPAQKKKTC